MGMLDPAAPLAHDVLRVPPAGDPCREMPYTHPIPQSC